jgi:hypothetical protein
MVESGDCFHCIVFLSLVCESGLSSRVALNEATRQHFYKIFQNTINRLKNKVYCNVAIDRHCLSGRNVVSLGARYRPTADRPTGRQDRATGTGTGRQADRATGQGNPHRGGEQPAQGREGESYALIVGRNGRIFAGPVRRAYQICLVLLGRVETDTHRPPLRTFGLYYSAPRFLPFFSALAPRIPSSTSCSFALATGIWPLSTCHRQLVDIHHLGQGWGTGRRPRH